MKRFLLIIGAVGLCVSLSAKKVEQNPLYSSYFMAGAMEAINNGDHITAIDYLDAEVKQNPENGYAYMLAGYIWKDYDYQTTYPYICKALQYIPANDKMWCAFTLSMKADCLLAAGDTLQALNAYNQAIKLHPRDSYYASRGEIYLDQQNYAAAKKDAQALLKLDAQDATAYHFLGVIALNQDKNYPKAIEYFSKAKRLAEGYIAPYIRSAEAYLEMHNSQAAVEELLKTINIDMHYEVVEKIIEIYKQEPETVRAAFAKGEYGMDAEDSLAISSLIFMGAQEYDRAIEAMLQIKERPVQSMLVKAYSYIGEYEKALPYAEAAYQENQYSRTNITDYLLVLINLQQYDKATELLNDLCEDDAEFSHWYALNALINNHLGNQQEAIHNLTTAILLAQGDHQNDVLALYYRMRAKLYEQENLVEQAQADLQKANLLCPEIDEEYQSILSIIK